MAPRSAPRYRDILLTSTCLVAAVAAGSGSARAQPPGVNVVSRQATLAKPTATSTVITQGSQKAIIEWQGFSIQSGASVAFQQPNSSAIALNRVRGPSASLIEGSLTANGNIWLINPNGVLVGPGVRVDVNSFLA